jgi:cell division protein FtsI/penicillin-binding protein 2
MKKNAPRGVTFNHNPLLEQGLPVWRPRLVLLALLGCSLALVGRALFLQGVNNEFLQAKGESRYARVIEVPATRGRIVDRQGDILAVSTPVRSPGCSRSTSPSSTTAWAAIATSSISSARFRPSAPSASPRSSCRASTSSRSIAATTRAAR